MKNGDWLLFMSLNQKIKYKEEKQSVMSWGVSC